MNIDEELRKLRESRSYNDHDLKPMTKKRRSLMSLIRSMKKKKAILIHMHHKNGTLSHFVLSKYKRSFILDKSEYIVDTDCLFYDNTYKMNALNYSEKCVMPFKVTTIKNNAELKCDPDNFRSIFKFEYVELLTNVAKMKDLMKFSVAASVLSAICSIILIILVLHGFGWI